MVFGKLKESEKSKTRGVGVIVKPAGCFCSEIICLFCCDYGAVGVRYDLRCVLTLGRGDAAVIDTDIVDKYVVGDDIAAFWQIRDEDIGCRVACFAVAAYAFFPVVNRKLVDRFKASRTVVGQGYEIKVACCFDRDSYLNAVAYFECIGRFSDEFPGFIIEIEFLVDLDIGCLLYTSPSPRDCS